MNKKIWYENHRTQFVGPSPEMRYRVNESEREALEALAKYESVNLSEAWRMALREACRTRGLWPLKSNITKK